VFVDLAGEWWNIDHIAKIEPARHEGLVPKNSYGVIYMATLSTGDKRGLTEEEFRLIMDIKAKRYG